MPMMTGGVCIFLYFMQWQPYLRWLMGILIIYEADFWDPRLRNCSTCMQISVLFVNFKFSIANLKCPKVVRLGPEHAESDKAFALLVMCNEFHRWKEDADALENGEKQNNKRSRKTFVDPKSGSKVGWSKDGLELFNNLLRLVRHLRKAHNTGSQLEEAMRVQFAQDLSWKKP